MDRAGCFVLAASVLVVFGASEGLWAQGPDARIDQEVTGHSYVPERKEFSEDFVRQLKVPDGFRVNVFASGLENPRIMTVEDGGTVYMTQPARGNVIALRDTDNDGRADWKRVAVSGIEGVHGITFRKGKVYLASPTKLLVAEVSRDGQIGEPHTVFDDLPDGGQHPNRTLAFGPEGMLYLSVGSSCNACTEPNPEHATMLEVRLTENGVERRIFARGLRNTIGFGWHPRTREMWGMDHGSDWRGDDVPPEELNHIREGRHYGWPFCYGDRQVDQIFAGRVPGDKTKQGFCAETEPAVLEYQAHSAPLQLVFYDRDQFPAEYRNDAFVTMRGSWNRKPPVGYKVVRVRFNDDGRPERFEDFLTGFITDDGTAYLARLCGLLLARDGSLLVGDDTNGAIYRVSYR